MQGQTCHQLELRICWGCSAVTRMFFQEKLVSRAQKTEPCIAVARQSDASFMTSAERAAQPNIPMLPSIHPASVMGYMIQSCSCR